MIRNTLLQIYDILLAYRKGSIFTNLKNPKNTICLPRYIDVIHGVGQQFLPIVKNFVFYLLIPDRKLGSFTTWHKVCPIVLGFGLVAHIIQIVSRVEEVWIIPLLALSSNDMGMLLRPIGKYLSESRKWRFSTTLLRILLPPSINCGAHLSWRNLRRRNCASYPRDLCEIT